MQLHNAVSRALETLEFLASSTEPKTLNEICTHLDAPKTSMNPIIYTLLEKNFIQHADSHRAYIIGPASYIVGCGYLERFDILKYIRGMMEEIVHKCSETCYFATLHGPNVFYILKVDSPEKIRMASSVGTHFPAYATSLGKTMLIGRTKEEIAALYPEGLTALTEKTITNLDDFMAELDRTARRGYAVDEEESYLYVRCRAIPVFLDGKPVAALSISTPSFRLDEEKEKLILQLLKEYQLKLQDVIEKDRDGFFNII